jgi:peroxiredoxin
MARRRRRSTPSSSPIQGERESRQQPHDTEQRLRRPSEGHVAKRPRTVAQGPRKRTREAAHQDELELWIGEIDGLAELDEVSYVAQRRHAPVALVGEVDAQRQLAVIDGLLSKPLPALEMEWMPGEWIDISALGSDPLVLYCHPGAEPDAVVLDCEEQTLGADAAECRAFAEHSLELACLRHRVVGVSSQSASATLRLASAEALPHVVLSDDRLELAEEMGLPTFEVDGTCLYERLTLIVRDGRVEKVFYPVPDPATHAAEVAEWLRDGTT